MAAVMTVKIGRHTATFYDDAYINCTEEEIEARKQQARIVAEGIYARAALREREAASASEVDKGTDCHTSVRTGSQ